MYSQNQEEAVITAYFTSNEGRLLDIGAHDGVKLSNSRKLLENGWTGVLVEPSPAVFTQLLQNTEAIKDRVTLINAALTTKEVGAMVWHDSNGDFISTLSSGHVDKWSRNFQNWRSFIVHPLSCYSFFKTFGTDYDFVTIDVEGINYEILMACPLDLWDRAKMVCVEYDNKMQEITDYLTDLGFKIIHRNGENLIFIK